MKRYIKSGTGDVEYTQDEFPVFSTSYIYADDDEPSIADIMNEPIGDSGEPWEGDVDNFRRINPDESPNSVDVRQPLRDSEIDTLERDVANAKTKLALSSVLKKAYKRLLKPHTTVQENRINQLVESIKDYLRD